MSGVYGKSDDAEAIAVVHHAIDLGVNFLDSSDMYGWGHNEELLGRALRGRRDGVVLATKFGQTCGSRTAPPGVNGAARLRAAGLRGEPQAAGRRRDRPLLPAPGRPRRCRSRRRSARWRGWSSRARCGRSACREAKPGDHPPRAQGPSDRRACRASTRCSTARRRRRRCADHARARHLLRRLLAARPQPADRARPHGGRHPRRRPPRPPSALPGREPRSRTSSC